ncbi:hypothetical protein ABH922_001380 [Rhodococcus sp. 27YEA15]|uniref:STM4014 family protein n=1 Tax=Rhodococcus sp. 27YEA15 TaxID=3156259 RepID=UPI003C7C298F
MIDRGPRDPSAVRTVVIGVPGNRRVQLFVDAAHSRGLPEPRVIGWDQIIAGRYGFEAGEIVRIDSPAEDPEVELAFRGAPDSTRVENSRLWYRRFLSAVHAIVVRVEAAGAELLTHPDDIAAMFDKRRTHAILDSAGVRVPPALPGAVTGWDDLESRLRDAGMRRVFVKLAHGSSASGVIALQLGPGGAVHATTSVEIDDQGRLFNSLRVRTYRTRAELAAVIDPLATDGLHVERWLPKASLNGRVADVRVVVIGGTATHAVVRTSTSPMTNLHLGGARGSLGEAMAAAGTRWSGLLETAEQAARCFPRSAAVGVDVLPSIGWRDFAVAEVNAFGDLLPNLPGLPGTWAHGLDTYQAQVAHLIDTRGRQAAS